MKTPASDQPICPYVDEPCCDWEPQDEDDVQGPGECIAPGPEACPHNTGTDVVAIRQWQGREPLTANPLPDAACVHCEADVCGKCGECATQHNEDPVCNCPGTDGNPGPPSHAASLPDALEMLKLPTDKFLVEVSRAISPKPWPHKARAVDAGEMPPVECVQCDEQWDSDLMRRREHSPCPVPPIITESLADVAETLRKQLKSSTCVVGLHKTPDMYLLKLGRAIKLMMPADWKVRGYDCWRWWGWATPEQRIACFLVALGYWRIGEKT